MGHRGRTEPRIAHARDAAWRMRDATVKALTTLEEFVETEGLPAEPFKPGFAVAERLRVLARLGLTSNMVWVRPAMPDLGSWRLAARELVAQAVVRARTFVALGGPRARAGARAESAGEARGGADEVRRLRREERGAVEDLGARLSQLLDARPETAG